MRERSVPQPSAAQKDQILEKLNQTEQLSPDVAFPVAPTPKRRNAWKLATSCCMLALVLVGATAWFGRGWFGVTSDECMVFGDQMNDLGMFEICAHTRAVANAVPEVRAISEKIIPSNAEKGVFQELEAFLKGEYYD